MSNSSEAKLDKNLFTDTMPNSDSAFILFEKLTVARGRITYYTKDSNATYYMYLDRTNTPSGTWEKIAIQSDLTNYQTVSSFSYQGAITANTEIVLDKSKNWWTIRKSIVSISVISRATNSKGQDKSCTAYIKFTDGYLYLNPTLTDTSSFYIVNVTVLN